jgi:hypothetical protein
MRRLGHGPRHLPLSNAEVKNAFIFTSIPLIYVGRYVINHTYYNFSMKLEKILFVVIRGTPGIHPPHLR